MLHVSVISKVVLSKVVLSKVIVSIATISKVVLSKVIISIVVASSQILIYNTAVKKKYIEHWFRQAANNNLAIQKIFSQNDCLVHDLLVNHCHILFLFRYVLGSILLIRLSHIHTSCCCNIV
jgi:hypothetical protein